MSSPAGMSNSFNQWPTPQSHGSPVPANNECEEEGVEVRPMRLKVLYTFDDQNKTNCLARWPHVLQIQTVAMDETTSIGVIELKTCIQAIVQCSPELVARLGQDYTVYAYDYSEYDNPLVGQGMLSWALAAASPTPGAPAHQSRQLITGRVCKNIPGIFSNGIKETLEVKLRLVPVPTILQSEYISNMEKYREISKVIPPGLDINEWNAFLQSNPNIAQMANKFSAPTPPTSNQRDGVSMEVINQLLSPSLQQQPILEPFNQSQIPENTASDAPAGSQMQKTSRPSSRASVKRPYKRRQKANTASGNTSGYDEGTDAEERPAPKRRGKKNAAADEDGTDGEARPASKKKSKKNSTGDEAPEGTDADDGQGRKKRAKITKADWNSKDTIGSTSDSLRVAASTAASIRLFRPIAMNPTAGMNNHLQELPRAPTPVPTLPGSDIYRNTAASQSNLRRNSNLSQSEFRKHVSPYPSLQPPVAGEDNVMDSIESANPSPERNASQFGTPPDIGSSPPVMRTASPLQSSPAPSSPELPQMPRTDSGFMSGSLDDLFGEDDDESIRPIEVEEVEVTKKTKKRRAPRQTSSVADIHHGFVIQEETPGPMEYLPTKILRRDVPSQPKTAPIPRANSFASDGSTLPTLSNKLSGSAMSPSNPVQPDSQAVESPNINESQKSTPQPEQPSPSEAQSASAPASKADTTSRSLIRTASMGSLTLPALKTVAANDPVLPPSRLQRSQTWSQAPHAFTEVPLDDSEQAAKNGATRRRLEMAIEKGEMPPFCFNCGAIDTPTWRKVFTKEIEGTPGYYDYSDEPGKVMAIDILERDSQGQPKSFRLIKKSLAKGEEKKHEFKEMTLCNPCGIWIAKYKSQRPEDKFQKDPSAAPKKRKKKGQSNGQAFPTSDAFFPQSEGYFPQSEAPHPQSEANPQQADGLLDSASNPNLEQTQRSRAPLAQRRASSVRPPKRLKAMTSDAASAALRRAIQSSPARWMGSQQSPIEVEDEDLGETRRLLFPSPRKDGSPKVLGEVITNVITVATEFRSPKEATAEMADKENCPPAMEIDVDEELLKLFEEEMARPMTPVQKSPPQNPFKTPTRPTPNHRPITRSVTRSTRSARTAKSPGGIIMIQKTPTRTPGSIRRSPRNHNAVFESPFTATLNQLMTDANNNSFSPSRHNAELDFGSLPPLDHSHGNSMSFSHLPAFDSDFFSTDVPMPSSPPRMFSLYEDPHTMDNMDSMWNMNFDGDEAVELHGEGDDIVLVKTEPDTGEEVRKEAETSKEKDD